MVLDRLMSVASVRICTVLLPSLTSFRSKPEGITSAALMSPLRNASVIRDGGTWSRTTVK